MQWAIDRHVFPLQQFQPNLITQRKKTGPRDIFSRTERSCSYSLHMQERALLALKLAELLLRPPWHGFHCFLVVLDCYSGSSKATVRSQTKCLIWSFIIWVFLSMVQTNSLLEVATIIWKFEHFCFSKRDMEDRH